MANFLKILLSLLFPKKRVDTKIPDSTTKQLQESTNPQDMSKPGYEIDRTEVVEENKGVHYLVTRQEVLMNRDVEYPLNFTLEANLAVLLMAINKLRQRWGKPLIVSSGYRPGKYNEAAGGAKRSAHLYCEAVDFSDPEQKLSTWIKNNPDILYHCGLWMEDPEYTKTWCHLDIKPRNNRIFKP